MLDALVQVAQDIGRERFHDAIVRAIETCERRPTLATIRRIAGVNPRLDSNAEALAAAWQVVTVVVTRHIGRDGEGQAFLQPWLQKGDEVWYETPVPHIPEGVRLAVASLGGWGALADSWPQWAGQRFATFKEILRLSPEETLALTAPKTTAIVKK